MGWNKDHGTAAKVNAEYAKVQGDVAKQEASNLSKLKTDAEVATQNANTATANTNAVIEDANTAASNADNAASEAIAQANHAKNEGDRAKAEADRLAGTDVSVLDNKIGSLSSLNTTNKTSVVESVNEVTTQLDEKATKAEFNANDYGADSSATWTINRDAFQAANDAAAAIGGGRVVAMAGTYNVKGITQDSNVIFDLPGVIFKNPDGLSPSVINCRTFSTTGTISTNSNQLAVADVTNVKHGSVIVIHHAGGMLETQFTTLSNDLDSTTTEITIAQNNNRFPTSGYMLVGNELIRYTGITGNTLLGVERGALGTTATAHSLGSNIGVARHFYAEVTDLVDNVLTISSPVPFGVVGSNVDVGSVRPKIIGLRVDANKIPTGASTSVYGIAWSSVRWGDMKDVEVINGDMGGIFLGRGATECKLDNIRLHDCGVWESSSPKGSGLWLFQGCARNRINNITVTGKAWTGTYLDDRTTVASPYDAPNDDNIVDGFVYDLIRPAVGFPPAFVIVGSSRNKFLNGFVRGTTTGFEIDHGGQFLTPDGINKAHARDNEVAGVHLDVQQPWIIRAEGNRLHECTYTDKATSIPIVEPGNLVYAVTTTKGNSIEKLFEDIKFQNGTASAPSITWVNDPDTGFYKDSADIIRIAIGGTLKYSLYGSEFRLADGVNLTTGTGSGTKFGLTPSQKIGFYGKTPMSQPVAITNKTGQTLEQVEAELNLVKTTLRNLGLIAT